MNTPFSFVFVGRSGCGKGTQVDLLQKYLGAHYPNNPIFYLETGQGFRNFITQDNYTSKLSNTVYNEGDRQPDFLAIWMWSHSLVDNFTGKEHLIIDGAPRSYPEALSLATAMKFYKLHFFVIHLDVSREWSEKHLISRGRFDDVDRNKIKKRLDWFDADVMPAIDYFRLSPECRFVHVNGEQSIEAVHEEVIKGLGI